MKQPTKQQFKTLLNAACILTDLQDKEDEVESAQTARIMWNIVDSARKRNPELESIYYRL